MPSQKSNSSHSSGKTSSLGLSAATDTLELLAVSSVQFQARWSLAAETLSKGSAITAASVESAHLLLRVYSLSASADSDTLSNDWHDFSIEGITNSGYFNLPVPTAKINAALGLMDNEGRFSPLVRAQSIALPAAAPSSSKDSSEATLEKRLEALSGLPPAFKRPTQEYLAAVAAKESSSEPHSDDAKMREALEQLPATPALDPATILEAVRQTIAKHPHPEMTAGRGKEKEGPKEPPRRVARKQSPAPQAIAQLASQWETVWSDTASIEVHAEFILNGKIGPKMKLLLGNEIIQPAADGVFTWKQPLHAFHEAWPLIQAAMQTPVVPAGPSLEFFKTVTSDQRLLELHGALQIEGRVTNPDYLDRLPVGLKPDANGHFRLSRSLPEGAVILPGLSLVAGG